MGYQIGDKKRRKHREFKQMWRKNRKSFTLSEKETAEVNKSKREYIQKKRKDVRDNNAAIALRKKKKRHENSQTILGGRLKNKVERGQVLSE